MRAIIVALLLVGGTAFAQGNLVVDKKVTSLTTKDKTITKVDVLVRVPSTLECFDRARTVDVTLTVKDGAPTAKTNAKDATTNDCLLKAFAAMNAKGTFSAKVRLVSKPDTRKLDAIAKAIESSDVQLSMIQPAGSAQAGPGLGGGTGTRQDNSPATATTGSPDGSLGNYSMDDIQAGVKSQAGAIRACYQMELEKQPKLAGKFTYHVEIGETGTIASAKLKSSTVKSPKLDACIARQLMKLKFAAKGKASFDFPFVFQAQ